MLYVPDYGCFFDGSVKSPISALCVSLVTAEYFCVRLIPRNPQALISNFLRNRLKREVKRLILFV